MKHLLSEEGHVYDRNFWDYHSDDIRNTIADGGNISQYYLIEGGVIRLVPDTFTADLMHLNLSMSLPLTTADMINNKKGDVIPSRKDGRVYKAFRHDNVYIMEAGLRRKIPNRETIASLGIDRSKDVVTIPVEDLRLIRIGDEMPNVLKPAHIFHY
jgi:hypothetical protein